MGVYKGYKQTEEHKRHVRESNLNTNFTKRGSILSGEHKKKLSLSHIGKKDSLETRKKKSEARKRWKLSDKHKINLGLSKVGDKNPFWKGGISLTAEGKKHYFKLRKARVRGACGSHTNYEWQNLKAQYNWTCPCCFKKEPEIKLTEDHIIPISRGGSNNIENIQPLCMRCNSVKHTKIIRYNA